MVDDGSTDQTVDEVLIRPVKLIQLSQNQGKAEAIKAGVARTTGDILMFLDADLVESAQYASLLSKPVEAREADMVIGKLPLASNGGFGFIRKASAWVIYKRTGTYLQAPLSGQRVIRRDAFEQAYTGSRGFGFEVALNLDVLCKGYRVMEMELPFEHREHGKSIQGFSHRFKQGIAILGTFIGHRG